MSTDELQVGVNYFGRVVTGIAPRGDRYLVYYDDATAKDRLATLSEFLSWLNVQKGGEPTDRWHAFLMRHDEKMKHHTPRKRVDKDGKSYRKRRGKLVEIPEEWVGKVAHPQTIRKRPSKKSQGRRFKRKVMR